MDWRDLHEYLTSSEAWRSLSVEALGHIKDAEEAWESDWDMAANLVSLATMGRIAALRKDEVITIMAFTLALMARRQNAAPKVVTKVPDAFNNAFKEGELDV